MGKHACRVTKSKIKDPQQQLTELRRCLRALYGGEYKTINDVCYLTGFSTGIARTYLLRAVDKNLVETERYANPNGQWVHNFRLTQQGTAELVASLEGFEPSDKGRTLACLMGYRYEYAA